ncbi:hypothetical protein [Streptomyces zagrosensis]|uniref:Uncharacterized protein n=1 Tax=Streptomyces zagrosensis TaxID=1042984 RepID=A0A7W9Q7D6_9ACTN|nr:hypothetical protein [Streptomyces zagrosensis]MBB5934881.1 hypothetical protein [Streptomyces zagrosensis]
MSDRMDHGRAAQRHPELVAWRTARADGFEQWARETGTPRTWDFSPESLAALEDLVRDRYADPEELFAARREPFLQGACWYLGEVVCRAKGQVWKFEPFALHGAPLPPLFAAAYEPGTIDYPQVGAANADIDEALSPMGALYTLLSGVDDAGEPHDAHLPDLLEADAGDAGPTDDTDDATDTDDTDDTADAADTHGADGARS